MINTHRGEYKGKWYKNLPTLALNSLANAGILEEPEKVKELCFTGEIKKIRGIGNLMISQICVALKINLSYRPSSFYCPHCNNPVGIQLYKLKHKTRLN